MGDKRQEIERLGQTSIEVRRGLDSVRAGHLDYESALEAVVICLVEGNAHLKDRLLHYFHHHHMAHLPFQLGEIDSQLLNQWGVNRTIDKDGEECKTATACRMLDYVSVADAIAELDDNFRGVLGHVPGCECEACTQLKVTLGALPPPGATSDSAPNQE